MTLLLLSSPLSARAVDADQKTEADSAAVASGADTQGIAELILEATRLPTTVNDSPAIVSVIEAEQLQALGYRTIEEALRHLPGSGMARVPWWRDQPRTRGIPAATLVLLNGTPISSSMTSGIALGYDIDLDNVQRLEVFTSPGGVLWGAHAWLGVINVVTRDGRRSPGAVARVRLGSLGMQKYSLGYGHVAGPIAFHVHGAMTLDRAGSRIIQRPLEDLRKFSLQALWNERPNVAINPEQSYYGEVTARVQAYDIELYSRLAFERVSRQVSWVGVPLPQQQGHYAQPISMVHLAYAPKWGRNALLLKASYLFEPLDFSGYTANGVQPTDDAVAVEAVHHRVGAIAEFARSDRLLPWLQNRLTVGVEGSVQLLRDALFTNTFGVPSEEDISKIPLWDDATPFTGSIYFYNEVELTKWIILSGGVRFNAATESFYQPTWLGKADLVLRLSPGVRFKINYDEGMRPPTFEATQGVSGALYQPLDNPRAERSRVVSTQVLFDRHLGWGPLSRLKATLGYSYMRLSELIGDVGAGTLAFARRFVQLNDTLVIHSIDAEMRCELWEGVSLWIGAAHQAIGDFDFLPFAEGPATSLFAGARWQPKPWVGLSFRNRITLPFEGQYLYPISNTAISGADLQVNQATLELPMAWEMGASAYFRWQGLMLQLSAFNVLQARTEDVNQVSVQGASGLVWPAQERSVQLSLQYRY